MGSSPLTRGKHRKVRNHDYPHGLIPAHAGKTNHHNQLRRLSWAHPRSRGQNAVRPLISSMPAGSSPLTRGKLEVPTGPGGGEGLIPAHAGKTAVSSEATRGVPAHPRSRGENRAFDVLAVGRMGSSPLTRGKHLSAMFDRSAGGLIPAHAGKTHAPGVMEEVYRAHPRSRGENVIVVRVLAALTGSSPLTRGKPAPRGRGNGRAGLIPAHAGKTPPMSCPPTSSGAHPRSRGENCVVCPPPWRG